MDFILIIIILVILLTSISIGYIISKIIKKDNKKEKEKIKEEIIKDKIKECKEDEYYNLDTEKCEKDDICSTMCAGQCIDFNNYKCVNDTVICDNFRYNHVNESCCEEDERYNETLQQCEICPVKTDDNKCCNIGNKTTYYTETGATACCDREKIVPAGTTDVPLLVNDITGTQRTAESCCQWWDEKQQKCCGSDAYYDSVAKACLSPCVSGEQSKPCYDGFGNIPKCKEEETCFKAKIYDNRDDPNDYRYRCECIENADDCRLSSLITYTPSPLNLADGDSLPVCVLKDQINVRNSKKPLTSCKGDGNALNLGAYTHKQTRTLSDGQSGTCEEKHCIKHFYNLEGITDIHYDGKPNEKSCTATIDCAKIIPGTGESCATKCPVNDFPNSEENLRCCTNGLGKYNGLVCPANEICDNATDTCIRGWGFKPYPQPNNKGPHAALCKKIQKDDLRYKSDLNENPNSEEKGWAIRWWDDSQDLKLYRSLEDCQADLTEYESSSARCIPDSQDYEDSIKYTDASENKVPWPPSNRNIKNKDGGGPYYDKTFNSASGHDYGGSGPWFTNDGEGKCKRTSFRQAVHNYNANQQKRIYVPWRDGNYWDHCKINNMTTGKAFDWYSDHNKTEYACFENGVTYPKGTYMCGRIFVKGIPDEFAWKKCTQNEGCKTAAVGQQGPVENDWLGNDTGKPTHQDPNKLFNHNFNCDIKGRHGRDAGDCQQINFHGGISTWGIGRLIRMHCNADTPTSFDCRPTPPKPWNFFCTNVLGGNIVREPTCKNVYDEHGRNQHINEKCGLMDTKYPLPLVAYGVGSGRMKDGDGDFMHPSFSQCESKNFGAHRCKSRPRDKGNKGPLFCDLKKSITLPDSYPVCPDYGFTSPNGENGSCWQPGGDCGNTRLQIHKAEEDTEDQYTGLDRNWIDKMTPHLGSILPTLSDPNNTVKDYQLLTYKP